MDELIIHEFRPLFLTLDQIGPFRNLHSIDLTDTNHHPCNFYMMVSANGFGKTTALEIFTCLVYLLGKKDLASYGHEDLDRKGGRAQLDFWVRLHWQGRERAIVLSIVAGKLGEETYLKPWPDNQLVQHHAESWHHMGFRSPVEGRYVNIASPEDELLKDFSAAVRASQENTSESDFLQPRFHLPSVLYFSAYRDIPPVSQEHRGAEDHGQNGYARAISQPSHWNYSPLHAFDAHSTLWRDSLDNLLVWLKWLDNGSFETAQRLINEQLFQGTPKRLKGVRKSPPEAQVDAGDGGIHRLDRLSSGEKSLAHLFLRIAAHATANTIILIDEMDAHLHIRWAHRLYNALEQLVLDHPRFTVIMTTHSIEILRRFTAAMSIEQAGLYLGGNLIEEKDLA
jgi:ABC-type lipoprotein export system ATPase subunit